MTRRSSTAKEAPIPGDVYLGAMQWALLACPRGKGSSMAQVVFVDNVVVCSDGRRWHVPQLPIEAAVPHVVVTTRNSVDELVLALQYASKVAKRRGGGFVVVQDGLVITIRYAKRDPLVVDLEPFTTGYVPSYFNPPVPRDAPELAMNRYLDCRNTETAMSWAKGSGTWTMRGMGGPKDPVRIDLYRGGELDATAYLLPKGRPAAALPSTDGQLFQKVEGQRDRPLGQSILDLQLDVTREAPPPSLIRIGDVEIPTTGLTDAEAKECLKVGPCSHVGDGVECITCTRMAVEGTLALKAEQADVIDFAEAKRKAGKGPKGGKRGGGGGKKRK